MSSAQIFTGLPIILTAISLIVSIVVLIRQREFQKDIATLQNKLTARREIAREKLDDILAIKQWVEDGFEVQKDIWRVQDFLEIVSVGNKEGYSIKDPNFKYSEIREKYRAWSMISERLILFAQIYDPKYKKISMNWTTNIIANCSSMVNCLMICPVY